MMVGRDKFLNGPARYRLEGILMGILVSGDLVVKFANLVVKMEHLVVILSDLVVKNTGLVVIVLFRKLERRVSPTEKAFGGSQKQ